MIGLHRGRLTHRQKQPLGLRELVAIALGGMIGGGIFAILGVSTANIGNLTPIAILLGGMLALLAAYSYAKLSVLYRDDGATYSFFKRTFPRSHLAGASIGWVVSFGYVATLALYAFTFASYLTSILPFTDVELGRRLVAGAILLLFTVINVVSVKGMGEVEDLMVYTKLVLLAIIAIVLWRHGQPANLTPLAPQGVTLAVVLMTASITFVAYEGFQLTISATNETDQPDRDIPRAMYLSIGLATLIYAAIAAAALAAIPKADIVRDKEYALAAGASAIVGNLGLAIVIAGALLATSSAISGTLFGASRVMARVADDGYLPGWLARRERGHIPALSVVTLAGLAYLLVFLGGLEEILEFGSITFILVSFLMALANYVKRRETRTSVAAAIGAMVGLAIGGCAILYYQWSQHRPQLYATLLIYAGLSAGAWMYSRRTRSQG